MQVVEEEEEELVLECESLLWRICLLVEVHLD